jgi:hypothetical protein
LLLTHPTKGEYGDEGNASQHHASNEHQSVNALQRVASGVI